MDVYDILLLTIFSSCVYIYWYLKKTYSFFQEHGIPFIKPTWIFGNVSDALLLKKHLFFVYHDLYRKLEPHKLAGFFAVTKPTIMIRDAELIKNILVKDFAYFQERDFTVDPKVEPLLDNLFSQKGEEWRNSRIKLTSTFTTCKMKMMLPLIQECGEKMKHLLDNMSNDESFDAKELIARFTTDIVGTCAFGLNTNCLEDADSEFRKQSKKMFEFRYFAILRSIWPSMPASWVKLLGITFLSKSTEYFFKQIVDKTVQYRETNKIARNDFLDLLIALKNGNLSEKYHDNEKDLQKFISQIGGKSHSNIRFEPTSSTLSFLLFELAQNPQIQDKIRNEINTILEKNNGQLTYDVMKQMTYTDMAITETLRKYPLAGALNRKCMENYKVPDTDIVIPKGTMIIIPIIGTHLDAKYFEKPNQFYPEHFTELAKSQRPHYAYLPFGEGPRMCIAERFAKMQVKVGLIYMLRDFSYRTSSKMKLPMEFEKTLGVLQIKGGVWLEREKI